MTAPLIPSATAPQPPPVKEKSGEAARMLEAYFLRRMMAEVRTKSEDGLLAPGFGGQMFKEMLDEALADRMAEGGGIGLAKMVERQLGDTPAPRGTAVEALSGLRDGPGGHGIALGASQRSLRAAYGGAAPSWRGPVGSPPPGGSEWVMPVDPTRIGSGLGMRFNPVAKVTRMHNGIDMTAPMGAEVRAARGGQVIRAGAAGTFGNLVVVDHGGGLRSYYGHLSSVDVPQGARVEAGAPIGKVGSTGNSSGPHLHFEVRQDGIPIDPSEGLKIEKTRSNP